MVVFFSTFSFGWFSCGISFVFFQLVFLSLLEDILLFSHSVMYIFFLFNEIYFPIWKRKRWAQPLRSLGTVRSLLWQEEKNDREPWTWEEEFFWCMKTKDERKASGSEEMKLLILRRTSDRIKPWRMVPLWYHFDILGIRYQVYHAWYKGLNGKGKRGCIVLIRLPIIVIYVLTPTL